MITSTSGFLSFFDVGVEEFHQVSIAQCTDPFNEFRSWILRKAVISWSRRRLPCFRWCFLRLGNCGHWETVGGDRRNVFWLDSFYCISIAYVHLTAAASMTSKKWQDVLLASRDNGQIFAERTKTLPHFPLVIPVEDSLWLWLIIGHWLFLECASITLCLLW